MSDEKRWIIYDLESGIPYEVSKEYYDSFMRVWELCTPKLKEGVGTQIYVGTGGEVNIPEPFYELLNLKHKQDEQ